MYRGILVPTDGSEGTARALEHAIELAERYDAVLHTVYVVDTNFGVGVDTGMGGVFDALEQAGERALETVHKEAKDANLTVKGSLMRGRPHRAILDYVDDHEVDLVVMGTHGRTGLDRYLLGSVTEKVVRLSRVPVLTVPLADGDTE